MERTVGGATVTLVNGNIVDQRAGAIVNAANSTLLGGGGVDGAIHAAGGPAILEDCLRLRKSTLPDGLPTGEAVMTDAGNLKARYVIHTVGPVYEKDPLQAPHLLARCYSNVLQLCRENAVNSVSFPSISTGVFGYPILEASRIALQTVTDVLRESPEFPSLVHFVLFGQYDFDVYARTLLDIHEGLRQQ